MIDTAYAGTNLDGQVTSVGGIQNWVVPASGPYLIEAFGGQGYGPFGGRGAHIAGEFNLNAGDTLKILVGQRERRLTSTIPQPITTHQFGGGGGSFVTMTDNTAGGGGWRRWKPCRLLSGQATDRIDEWRRRLAEYSLGRVAPGVGSQQATSADGGGGLLGNGNGTAAGQAFVNGGLGGSDEGLGGFGGGGGTSSWNNYRGGGGGVCSGGGGGNDNSSSTTCCAAGRRGGSYNAGTNPSTSRALQLGDGLVRITFWISPSAAARSIPVLTPPSLIAMLVFDGVRGRGHAA
ncbi:MAG: hypothetical protein R3F40_15580 [Candidatus Competibacteraceae bacterium]